MLTFKKTFFLILFIFSLFQLAQAGHPNPFASKKIVGQKASDFKLTSTDGKTITLSALKGKVVLIYFWATWCDVCKKEIPSLNQLQNKYKKDGFFVLGIAKGEGLDTIHKFLKNTGNNATPDFTLFGDENSAVSNKKYKVFAVPMAFLISRDGNIVKRYFSKIDFTKDGIHSDIEKLLH